MSSMAWNASLNVRLRVFSGEQLSAALSVNQSSLLLERQEKCTQLQHR